MAKVAVIGGGFSGLSAACYVAVAGHEVHLFEKNATLGGRARQFKTESGYTFDMGPSWYWMPGIFERFFSDFGFCPQDFYELKLLDPSFEVVFANNERLSIPSKFDNLCALFESIERGSGERLKNFMVDAEKKYRIAIDKMLYLPGLSIFEFANRDVITLLLGSRVFQPFSRFVREYFSDPRLLALMEFPILFLGAMPREIPAMYSLMNYAGFKLGNWYPVGGFGKVIDAMTTIAKKNGVTFHLDSPVSQILVDDSKATALLVAGETLFYDGIIASADYSHVEHDLLSPGYTNYENKYWSKKKFAPSCLIYYIGVSEKIDSLQHHTLFLDDSSSEHAREIYETPRWPTNPEFYVCCPSKSDHTIAPTGHENLFFLMPIAPGLEDSESLREKYFNIMLKRLEKHIGRTIENRIDFKKSYCVQDFINDYNAYKGNAYGLSNTLNQTAILKPKIKNQKIKNLFYAGQLTVPGPGVPPSIISGKIAGIQLLREFKGRRHEGAI